MNYQSSRSKKKEKKNWLERAVLVAGSLLVLATLVLLAYQAITYRRTPPKIMVTCRPDPLPGSPNRYHLTIRNTGNVTAEQVRIELCVQRSDTCIETSVIEIPFVPVTSEREFWTDFSLRPSPRDSIQVRVISFNEP